tara:strand:+ start:243 stop:638 length:396 start_codon:yes stop_codon:yes gene_type:complete
MGNIQILVYSPQGLDKIIEYNNSNPDNTFDLPLVKVRTMVDDCYMIQIGLDRLDNLELQIGLLGTTIDYIGCWNIDGSKVVFQAPHEHRNFNKAFYIEKLLPKADGTLYTEADFEDVKIDFWAGWASRDLS